MDNSLESVHPTAAYWVNRWEYRPMPWEIAVATSVVCAFLAVIGAVANGLVIFIIKQINKTQVVQHMDVLILSLCFSDFLSSVVVQPQLIPRILPRSRVPADQSLSAHVSIHFCLTAGSLSLFFLTLNRYVSIKFPYYYARHLTLTKIYGGVVIIFSAAVALVIWVFIDGETESSVFPIIISVVFSLTAILQIMIFAVVHTQNQNVHRQIVAVQHNQTPDAISHMTRRTIAQRSKPNRTILYICVVFITTWLPSIIFRIYYVIHGNLTFYLQWLHIFNVVIQLHSCINPFIYVLRTSRVKQAMIRIFRRHTVNDCVQAHPTGQTTI